MANLSKPLDLGTVYHVAEYLESLGHQVQHLTDKSIYLSDVDMYVVIDADSPDREEENVLVLRRDDSLSLLYVAQRLLQVKMGYRKGSITEIDQAGLHAVLSPDRVESHRRSFVYATKELDELMDEVEWKWHRPENLLVNQHSAAREFADVFVFLLNDMAALGISDKMLYEALEDIMLKNHGRLESGKNVTVRG